MGGGSSLTTKGKVLSLAERLPDHHSLASTSTSGLRAFSPAPVTNYVRESMDKQVLTVIEPSALSQKSILLGLLGNCHGGGP